MLETKSTDDLNAAFGDFMRAFDTFKATNDERLSQLERRSSADVVTTDKVDRLNRTLDETKRVVDDLALKAARPHLGGPGSHGPRSANALQHKAAFDAYVRTGDAATLRDLESKALSVGSNPDGGYLVPEELERTVKHARITGAGIFKDAASDALIRDYVFAGTIRDWQVVIPDFGTVAGPFQIAAFELTGRHDGEVGFELSLESAGELTFAAL